MSELRKFKMKDIAKFNTSSYSNNDNWDYVNYLDTGNLTQNKISEIQNINIATDKLPSRARRKVRKNSILFSTVRPNQLHYGIISNPMKNMLVSTGYAVIDVNNDIANPFYIYYLLTQNTIVQKLQNIADNSTSAYPSITSTDIENLDIELPNLLKQNYIAQILFNIDNKIELNHAINNNLSA